MAGSEPISKPDNPNLMELSKFDLQWEKKYK